MRRDTSGSPRKTSVSISSMSFWTAGDDGDVAVDHGVEDRVEDGLGTEFQQLRGVLHAAAHRRQVRRRTMPDGDHEVGAHEDVQFAEVDLLGRVQIAGRAQDDEECVAVALQLRSLVCLHRVLDGERMQVELGGQGEEFGLRGAGEADPCHAGGLVAQLSEGVGEGGGGRDPYAVAVQGRLYDAVGGGGFRLRRVGARRRGRHAGRGRMGSGRVARRAFCRSWRSDGGVARTLRLPPKSLVRCCDHGEGYTGQMSRVGSGRTVRAGVPVEASRLADRRWPQVPLACTP